jgi:hypothetical protein
MLYPTSPCTPVWIPLQVGSSIKIPKPVVELLKLALSSSHTSAPAVEYVRFTHIATVTALVPLRSIAGMLPY